MQKFFKILRLGSKIAFSLLVLGFTSILVLYLYLEPELPSIEGLSDIQLQVPLRVYSEDGSLMAVYGEKRRTPKALKDIPEKLRQAFLAAEDDRFYEHPGVDYQGILRAMMYLIKTGERGQGGSTITMQLARNFYLSREKTYARKLNEIFLALKIEQQLEKDSILELYLNKIYLGNRAYGISAASRVYYGKEMKDLNLSQIAMLAGLPKAPSRYNPIINPDRAVIRRNYVLNRMAELGFISEADARWARAQPATAGLHDSPIEISAHYVAEMVRAEISRQFGEEAYNKGLRVYTTIDKRLQMAANSSVQHALLNYDMRHGFRGAEQHINLHPEMIEGEESEVSLQVGSELEKRPQDALLDNLSSHGNLLPAVVIEVGEQDARLYLKGGRLISLDWNAMSWAKPYADVNQQGAAPEKAEDIVKVGDLVRIYRDVEGNWKLGQIPEVQGALTAISPSDGAIKALVGGFAFYQSKFNRATQARRQAGSSFKPFIYSAAMAKNYTAASIINDAPVVFHDPALEGTWRPENYSGKFYGPTRLRKALFKSRNLVSIRLLRSIGVGYAKRFAARFGFDTRLLPHDLSLSLGSGEMSPLNLSQGFAVFANGGYRIQPYFIKRIEDINGKVLFEADPEVACASCVLKDRGASLPTMESALVVDGGMHKLGVDVLDNELVNDESEAHDVGLPRQAERALDERIVYIMGSILQDVIKKGTGRRARALGRSDLHGKTGTTNDQKDAWFNGFNRSLVATVWVGFDQQTRSLGNYETGSRAALPMWIEFMRTALQGVPEEMMPTPENIVSVKINSETGELASAKDKNAIFEIFRAEFAPKSKASPKIMDEDNGARTIPEQLF